MRRLKYRSIEQHGLGSKSTSEAIPRRLGNKILYLGSVESLLETRKLGEYGQVKREPGADGSCFCIKLIAFESSEARNDPKDY